MSDLYHCKQAQFAKSSQMVNTYCRSRKIRFHQRTKIHWGPSRVFLPSRLCTFHGKGAHSTFGIHANAAKDSRDRKGEKIVNHGILIIVAAFGVRTCIVWATSEA